MNIPSQTAGLYENMRSAVLSLELIPGERLTERSLETTYGASRTPIRAVLMRLETEGLVKRDGRGWIVSPIDLSEISALAEFREAIERAAIRGVILRASDSDIDSLFELLESFREAASEEDSLRAGGDFHLELAQLSGNRFFVDSIQGVMTRLARTRWLEVRTQEAREQAWLEHHEILEKIGERDVTAVELVSTHIRETNERLLDHLAKERRRFRGSGLSIVDDSQILA